MTIDIVLRLAPGSDCPFCGKQAVNITITEGVRSRFVSACALHAAEWLATRIAQYQGMEPIALVDITSLLRPDRESSGAPLSALQTVPK